MKTVCPIRILLLVARVHVRAVSVDQCSIFRKHPGSLYDTLPASFRRRQEEIGEQGTGVGSSSNLVQHQIDQFVMKPSSISIAVGSHDYKALPIVPV